MLGGAFSRLNQLSKEVTNGKWGMGNLLGSGQNDKWFPTPSTFKITSPPVGLPLDARVSTLINHLDKCWHTNLIRQVFSSEDATMILGIPLSSRLPVAHLIWVYTPRGQFMVCSAYKVALSITAGPSPKTSNEEKRGAFRNLYGVLMFQIRLRILHGMQVEIYF